MSPTIMICSTRDCAEEAAQLLADVRRADAGPLAPPSRSVFNYDMEVIREGVSFRSCIFREARALVYVMRTKAVCSNSLRFMEEVWHFAFETAFQECNLEHKENPTVFLPLFAVLVDHDCSDAEANKATCELGEGMQLSFPGSFKGVRRLSSLSSPNAMLDFANDVRVAARACENSTRDWSTNSKCYTFTLVHRPKQLTSPSECHQCFEATRTPSPREELAVLIVGSVQEQNELCRAANIQKQQPSFDADVYLSSKPVPVMQRDEHLSPVNDVVKPVRVLLHFELCTPHSLHCVHRLVDRRRQFDQVSDQQAAERDGGIVVPERRMQK